MACHIFSVHLWSCYCHHMSADDRGQLQAVSSLLPQGGSQGWKTSL